MICASPSQLTSSHPSCLGSEPAFPAVTYRTSNPTADRLFIPSRLLPLSSVPLMRLRGSATNHPHMLRIFHGLMTSSLSYSSRLFVLAMYDNFHASD